MPHSSHDCVAGRRESNRDRNRRKPGTAESEDDDDRRKHERLDTGE